MTGHNTIIKMFLHFMIYTTILQGDNFIVNIVNITILT